MLDFVRDIFCWFPINTIQTQNWYSLVQTWRRNYLINMKTILVLCAVTALVLCRPEEGYSTKYDDFNAQELAENARLLKSYLKCFLEQGPCTPEGSDFKKIIPDAVKTKCSKCNAKQRQLIRIVVKAMEAKQPQLWQELVKKEDPHGQYKADFEDFINSTN